MDIVGGKWKMVILWHLRNGTLRFNEHQAVAALALSLQR